ncbi:alpha/beta hydrolase [Peristeroidobacter agariperforans]|uniref:alpha/beta hydrolase n=1 Tax=Peristeroidobacter agariperforans TaxID=268404 RepID=UPI00101C3962|nr:alpha/beta hydrolase [Peristeroidobacter agariperforans]
MIFRCALSIGMWCLLSSSASLADATAAKLEFGVENNIAYYDAAALARADDYQKQQSKLDVYYPKGAKSFTTVVWFHGGGLTGGSRYFPDLKDQGIALVAASYRFAPKAQPPAYLEDSAAAVAWVLENIGRYGGDPKKVFVSGHSAGAYLATMIAMDPKWLGAHQLSNKSLAGVIAISGQMTTHFTVKKQRGDDAAQLRPIIDEYAPLYHAANEFSPICLIVGGRDIEFKSRVEENELMAVTLRNLGHKKVEFYEMAGLDHGTVEQGAMIVMRGFIQRTLQGNDRE